MADRRRGARARPQFLCWGACVLVAGALPACSTSDGRGTARPSGRAVQMHVQNGSGGGGGSMDNALQAGAPASSGSTGGTAGQTSAPAFGGADAGTYKPRADLDPNVTFDWEEKPPGGGGNCQAGTYTGTFQCDFVPNPDSGFVLPDGSDSLTVSGPITLHFEKSADGEFLELANAQLDGVAQDWIGFMADLSGRLDCTTLELTSQAENGVYGLGVPVVIPTGIVEGTLEGTLDLQAQQLSGTWMLSAGDGVGTCIGPWTASYTP
jgi:hypothetical protein